MASRLSKGIVDSMAVLPWFGNGGGLQKGGEKDPCASGKADVKNKSTDALQERFTHTFWCGLVVEFSFGLIRRSSVRAPPIRFS